MQNLPIILAVFTAAAAIIAVLFWRTKTQSAIGTEPLTQRVSDEVHRVQQLQAKLDEREIALRKADLAAATAIAQHEAVEGSKADLIKRLSESTQKLDTLQSAYNTLTDQASAAKADAEHMKIQIDGMGRTIETLNINLTEERAKLNQALTKQQSDEAAVSQFKLISQEILDKTLADAKQGIGELAKSLQKSSGDELEKHAGKVAQTLQPLQAKLVAYDEAIKAMTQDSQKSFGGLTHQITELQKAERTLQEQAKALTTALSTAPKLKGTYGELTLKRLIDFAGLQNHLHYKLQEISDTVDGRKIPDLVVYLPDGQKVLVDAKAVMDACVSALQTEDEIVRKTFLDKHSNNVKSRVVDLSAKNYFHEHKDAVNAVILFLPAEHLYSTAMENDPNLIEFAMERNIIICGPNSLMMLLKVANQLWQRASIEEEAQKIKECGDAIYKAACLFIERYSDLGTKIEQLGKFYNEAAGTLNGNLIPKGRDMSRFTAVVSSKEIKDIDLLKENIRPFSSPEAKKLLATTPKLSGLLMEDETAELSFAAGDE